MSVRVCSLLILVTALTAAAESAFRAEAEDLLPAIRVVGGGELRAVDEVPGGPGLSGGRAICLVPRGVGDGLDIPVTVATAGIYRLHIQAVHGPGSGAWTLLHDGRDAGEFNLAAPTVYNSREKRGDGGWSSKRLLLRPGLNVLRLVNSHAGPRGRGLVLDEIHLEHAAPPPAPVESDAVDEPPAGERLGPELVVNGDGEAFLPHHRFTQRYADVGGWQLNSPPPATPIVVRDPALAHGGSRALHLVPDPLEDNLAVYQTVAAASGHRYRWTLWIRGHGGIYLSLYQRAPARSEDTVRGSSYFRIDGDDWQRLSVVFAPSASAKADVTSIALTVVSDSDLYLDDVSVREVLHD